jgi:hypothetical protein
LVYEFLGLLAESYGTWLLLQRLVDASKDLDIPKNVPFAFAINNRNTEVVPRSAVDRKLVPFLHTRGESFRCPDGGELSATIMTCWLLGDTLVHSPLLGLVR